MKSNDYSILPSREVHIRNIIGEHTGECSVVFPLLSWANGGKCGHCYTFDGGKTFWHRDLRCSNCGSRAGSHSSASGECPPYDKDLYHFSYYHVVPWDVEFYKKLYAESIEELKRCQK